MMIAHEQNRDVEPGQTYLEAQTKIAHAPLRSQDEARLSEAPSASVLDGVHTQVDVPNTLDLSERLRQALVPLTNRFFPDQRWMHGFHVLPTAPYCMAATEPETGWLSLVPKFIEAQVYARLASGSDLNLDVDRKLLATQLGLLGEDGLSYDPAEVLPDLDKPRGWSEIWAEGRWLETLAVLAQIDRGSRWERIAQRKVDRLLSLTGRKDGFLFFAEKRFYPGSTAPRVADEPKPAVFEEPVLHAENDPCWHAAYCIGAVANGAGRFYRASGYEPAYRLCEGLSRCALARIYTHADGRYFVNHFYHGVYPLIALAEYAVLSQDTKVFDRVRSCYQWARAMGDPLTGFYAGNMPGGGLFERRVPEYMEVCALANLILVALALSRSGVEDCWDDVDCWVRNQYAQAQMLDVDYISNHRAGFHGHARG